MPTVTISEQSRATWRDFEELTGKLMAGLEWRYERWLETPRGDCTDESYCPQCVVIQRYANRHKGDPFTRISGWDEWYEKDSLQRCERCDAPLWFSPTDYCIEESLLPWLDQEQPESIDAVTAGELYLSLARLSEPQAWWPQMEPHAARILAHYSLARAAQPKGESDDPRL